MRWTPGGESSDIEDRRGAGGGGFRLPGGRPLGLLGLVLVGGLSLLFRQNLFALLDTGGATQTTQAPPAQSSPQENREVQFVSFVLDDTQNVWTQKLQGYHHAKLVLFRDATRSGCGTAQSETGPFYCPADEKVYLDLGFFDELRSRFGARGEFAEAYVVAHELGHHVQKLMGLEQRVRAAQERSSSERNALSVRMELQADCFAGVWAHSTDQRQLLEKGDVESALSAAAAVGDDRLQKQATGHVNPETFTHGSAQQRVDWFSRGMKSGDPSACDTFR